MFYRRKLDDRINKTHEYALRIAYNDCQCTFEDLERNNSVSNYERDLQKISY